MKIWLTGYFIVLNRYGYIGASLCLVSLVAQASGVTDSTYPGASYDVMRNKLVGIYTTFQLTDTVISGCNRLEAQTSSAVTTAFEDYADVARDYIQEGKRLLNEELSAVEVIEWKSSLEKARQHYQQKFSQLSLVELRQECQQLASEMATINKRVIALKSQ